MGGWGNDGLCAIAWICVLRFAVCDRVVTGCYSCGSTKGLCGLGFACLVSGILVCFSASTSIGVLRRPWKHVTVIGTS